MGPGGPRFGPVNRAGEKNKEPLPRHLREVPGYLKRVFYQFFKRLFYIFGLVWNTAPWILILLTVIAVLNGLLPVVTAWVGALLLNLLAEAFVAARDGAPIAFRGILGLLLVEFITIFLKNLLGHLNSVVIRISGEMVSNHVREMMMEKAKTVDLQSFDNPNFYERLENAQREAGMRPIQIIHATFTTISTLLGMISFVAILSAISPIAPIVILIMSLPSAIITYAYRKKSFQYVRHRSKDRRQLNYYSDLMTNKDMVKEIRIFGLADTFRKRYRLVFQNYFQGLRRLYVKEGLWNTAVSLLHSLVSCLLFLYVATGVWKGRLQVGDYSLYTGALNSISGGVTTLISATSTIYEGTLFIDNLITFMKEEASIVPLLEKPLVPKRHQPHRLELKDVSFRYPGTERFVLRHINAVIEPGQTVALVGVNGAGKTTLIKLLTRLYDPTEGEILLDGHNLKEYDLEELYGLFGIIFQDFGKYAVTVEENIAFGEVGAKPDQTRIQTAARQSNAADFIARLPQEYHTPLMRYFEEDGIELSIGQWQKLSIARAFYGDADILILDEPTASLDAIAEQEVYDQFDRLRKDKTTIFVSHRLSSATSADVIFVLDNNALAEVGNHFDLMAQKGVYYNLFSTQASRYQHTIEEK